jgi:CO/xanthine dehydrogenase FAD-binding subunit
VDLNTVSEFAPAPDATWRDGDAWLGGGTYLFSVPQPKLTRLLDLQAFGWTPIEEKPDGVLIAATCTFAQLARWQPADLRYAGAALLARQCCHALLGSFKVHNVATVGGNICLSLPAGPMTSFASALDGSALLRGPDGTPRAVPVASFVTGDNRNVLRPGELLTHVWLPARALTARFAFRQLSLSPVGRSAVLVIARRATAASATAASGTAASATAASGTAASDSEGYGTRPGTTAVTVTASTPRPVQLRFPAPPDPAEAQAMLDSTGPNGSRSTGTGPTGTGPQYLDDVHGSAPWREAMTRRLVTEVLGELAG